MNRKEKAFIHNAVKQNLTDNEIIEEFFNRFSNTNKNEITNEITNYRKLKNYYIDKQQEQKTKELMKFQKYFINVLANNKNEEFNQDFEEYLKITNDTEYFFKISKQQQKEYKADYFLEMNKKTKKAFEEIAIYNCNSEKEIQEYKEFLKYTYFNDVKIPRNTTPKAIILKNSFIDYTKSLTMLDYFLLDRQQQEYKEIKLKAKEIGITFKDIETPIELINYYKTNKVMPHITKMEIVNSNARLDYTQIFNYEYKHPYKRNIILNNNVIFKISNGTIETDHKYKNVEEFFEKGFYFQPYLQSDYNIMFNLYKIILIKISHNINEITIKYKELKKSLGYKTDTYKHKAEKQKFINHLLTAFDILSSLAITIDQQALYKTKSNEIIKKGKERTTILFLETYNYNSENETFTLKLSNTLKNSIDNYKQINYINENEYKENLNTTDKKIITYARQIEVEQANLMYLNFKKEQEKTNETIDPYYHFDTKLLYILILLKDIKNSLLQSNKMEEKQRDQLEQDFIKNYVYNFYIYDPNAKEPLTKEQCNYNRKNFNKQIKATFEKLNNVENLGFKTEIITDKQNIETYYKAVKKHNAFNDFEKQLLYTKVRFIFNTDIINEIAKNNEKQHQETKFN